MLRKVTATLLCVAIIGQLPICFAIDNYRVAAKNALGTTYSNESNDRVRYAVIDLGTNQRPTRITNSGYVLFADSFSAQRWSNGKLETLARGTVQDINEQGTAVGYIFSNAYYTASAFRLRTQPGTPFTNLAAVWPAGQTAATELDSPSFDFDVVVNYTETDGDLGPTLEPYSCSSIWGHDETGYYGTGFTPNIRFKGTVKESHAFAIDDNGTVYGDAVPPEGFQTSSACPVGDVFGAIVDGFAWPGGRLGSTQLQFDSYNKRYNRVGATKTIKLARNGHTIGFSINGDLVDDRPVPFVPLKINSRGFVLTTNLNRYAIASPGANPQLVDTGIAKFKTVLGFNYREIATTDATGATVQKASPQLVGWDNSVDPESYDNRAGFLMEEDPATGKYGATKLTHLIAPNSGWEVAYAYDINDNGWIVGQGWYQAKDGDGSAVGDPLFRACLLVPIELKDIGGAGDADDQLIDSMQAMPMQRQGESKPVFWQRRNAYFQRPVPDRSIAYIEPHRAANNAPDMPRLVARLPGGPAGLKVKWRLEVEYLRGNGYRAEYVKEFTPTEDKVLIPEADQGDGNPVFTAEMDASEEWRIFDDWQNEISQRGFFGGTGKLYLWFPSQSQTAPTEPIITFRIGGKNPEPTVAKAFIQTHLCDNRLWFAYAIAKKESPGYDKPFYNQFFGSYRKQSGNDYDQNKDWQCWAKGWPVYNIDRASRTGPMTSAGGYGIFQVTGDAQSQWTVIPRRQIWNWQDNIGYLEGNVWRGAMGILKAKVQFVDARYDALQQTYRELGAIPNYPLSAIGTRKRFSGWDAYACKGYNGYGGTAPKVRIDGFGRERQWTVWHPQSNGWQFKDDGYSFAVWQQVEENN